MAADIPNTIGLQADLTARHTALLDALAALDLDIVLLKTRMVGANVEALEPLLGDAARLTDRRAHVLAELAPVEAALIAQRHRAMEAARDKWVADVEAMQANGHLPPGEEVYR